MPNHVKNRIEIIGSEEQIKAVVEKFSTTYPREKDKSYDGKTICKNKSNGGLGWLDEATNEFSQRGKETIMGIPEGFEMEYNEEWTRFPDFAKIVVPPNNDAYNDIPNQQAVRDDPDNWYKWNVANWGTKWNSYSNEKESENTFAFETTWSCVAGLIDIMSKQFPEVQFNYEYADEDTSANCGHGKFLNGVIEFNQPKTSSIEAYELAFKLRPELKDDYKLVGEKYVYAED